MVVERTAGETFRGQFHESVGPMMLVDSMLDIGEGRAMMYSGDVSQAAEQSIFHSF